MKTRLDAIDDGVNNVALFFILGGIEGEYKPLQVLDTVGKNGNERSNVPKTWGLTWNDPYPNPGKLINPNCYKKVFSRILTYNKIIFFRSQTLFDRN